MPSIAQQDYIVIKPKEGRSAANDVECLRKLKLACENGTIFDCLVKDTFEPDAGITRVIGASLRTVDVYNYPNSEINSIEIPYTIAQYQGLAAVQEAEDEKLGEAVTALPSLGTNGSYLIENNKGYSICADGKFLIPAVSGGKLASLTIAETGPGENTPFVNITWEDAQKLIGLPIS